MCYSIHPRTSFGLRFAVLNRTGFPDKELNDKACFGISEEAMIALAAERSEDDSISLSPLEWTSNIFKFRIGNLCINLRSANITVP